MKKRKYVTISAVIMLIVICVICVLCVKTAENGNSASIYFFGKAELQNTVEIPLSEADQLEVIYRSKNLKVYPIDGDTVIIKEYLLNDKKEAQAQVLYESMGDGRQKVTVKGGEINNIIIFGFFVGEERIEIYIPKEGLEDLSLQTHSGNITAQEGFSLQTEKLSVAAKSGNVKWHDTKSTNLQIQTSSGNITLDNLSGEMLVQASSGNIKMTKTDAKVEIRATSGNITMEQLSGQGTIHTSSGNIRVENLDASGDIEMDASSGNVRVALPEESSFQFEAETGSGNISTFFDNQLEYNKKGNQADGTVGENPAFLLRITTSSGNIRITAD